MTIVIPKRDPYYTCNTYNCHKYWNKIVTKSSKHRIETENIEHVVFSRNDFLYRDLILKSLSSSLPKFISENNIEPLFRSMLYSIIIIINNLNKI